MAVLSMKFLAMNVDSDLISPQISSGTHIRSIAKDARKMVGTWIFPPLQSQIRPKNGVGLLSLCWGCPILHFQILIEFKTVCYPLGEELFPILCSHTKHHKPYHYFHSKWSNKLVLGSINVDSYSLEIPCYIQRFKSSFPSCSS